MAWHNNNTSRKTSRGQSAGFDAKFGCFGRVTPTKSVIWLVTVCTTGLVYLSILDWQRLGAEVQLRPRDTPGQLDGQVEVMVKTVTRSHRRTTTAARAVATTSQDKVQNHTEYGVCSYSTTFRLSSSRQVVLNQKPFSDFLTRITCIVSNHVAVFSSKFARLSQAIVDPTKAAGSRKGGEEMSNVTNQDEKKEYLTLASGFFAVPCDNKPPSLGFVSKHDHLTLWAKAVTCYEGGESSADRGRMPVVTGTTIAIQRYEYVNLFCAMTEFYNTFVMMMLTGSDPSHVTGVLLVDAHPKGSFDSSWASLYGKVIRAKQLKEPTLFSHLVWSLISYSSPLWDTKAVSVPYLEDFRHFFLSRHDVSTDHVMNCSALNVIIIWRRNYVAHPRNPSGFVRRKFTNEKEILNQVKTTLGTAAANVTGVQLDLLPMKKQLTLISTCDVLIGMHGAGLAHVLFLPPTSGFVEIFPNSMRPSTTHFTAIGRWRKLRWINIHNKGKNNESRDGGNVIDLKILQDGLQKFKNQICKAKS